MNTYRRTPLASTTPETRRDGPQGPIASLADLSRIHYRTAGRIHACAAWQSQVLNAAAAVGAERVPYLTLVQRAREIVLRGATYTVKIKGKLVTFGASLTDEGGFVPLSSTTDAETAP